MVRIAVFVSGNGSNFENITRFLTGNENVQVALLVSNKADAHALQRAERLGVKTVVWRKADFADEQRTMEMLHSHDIHFIVLAGFLLMIPPYLIHNFYRRMVNIHPSLLPKFGGRGMYGNHVHEAVKAAGETETGITIHYVSDECDGGDIIRQEKTQLSPTDTPDDIAAKVHALEKEYFPQTILDIIERLR
ncbi:MAG: phosphoribosylglycinamide formyltransferase [Prevotella sp.]